MKEMDRRRRKWQPTPVFLPGKSHGQRSLACCSPWGRKRVGHDRGTEQQQQNVDECKKCEVLIWEVSSLGK